MMLIFNRGRAVCYQTDPTQIRTCGITDADFYIASLSGQVIVYKGLMMPEDLGRYYPDLINPEFKSAVCLFHQRFSTNTSPKWPLAQPWTFGI